MSGLSVAARVKAHISTPYIDADGRGVRNLDGTGLSERPACMLPPDEFHKRRVATSMSTLAVSSATGQAAPASGAVTVTVAEPTTEELLRVEEGKAALVSERLERHVTELEMRNHDKYRDDIGSVAAALVCIRNRRAERHERLKGERQSELDAAYAAQAESQEAMSKFVALSRDTSEGDLHRAEADAVARFVAASQRRGEHRRMAEATAQSIADRDARQRSVVAVVRDARKKAAAEEQAAAAQLQFKQELAKVTEHRRRQAELQKRRDDVQLKEDIERAVWRQKADALVTAEQRLAATATAKEKALHALVNKHREVVVDSDYSTLKALQAEFQRHANEIEALLTKETKGSGGALELVMVAARDSAKKKRCTFRGLEMLSAATMVPSAYTPTARPEMDNVDGKMRSQGVQMPEPESQRGGGRRKPVAEP